MEEKSITPEGIINQAMGMNMSFGAQNFRLRYFHPKFSELYMKCTNAKVIPSITRLLLS